MEGRRRLVHVIFLFLLPLLVAGFGLSLATAAGIVLLMPPQYAAGRADAVRLAEDRLPAAMKI